MSETRTSACIFISYASEQREIAESINLALLNLGLEVFFDRDSLVAGRDYNKAILDRVRASDLFLFLISPEAVKPGRYTLTELMYAREVWSSPSGHVLPIMVAKTDYEQIPQYLKAVTILESEGNLVAEVSTTVADLISGWDADELVLNQKKNVRMLQMQQELNDLAADARKRFGGDPPTDRHNLNQGLRVRKSVLLFLALVFLVPAAFAAYAGNTFAVIMWLAMGTVFITPSIFAVRVYASRVTLYIDAREQIKLKFPDCVE
jgi:hypothetical protein